ncbi:MAG: hypothetical protein QOJ44_1560, partial [Acidimicrobiaceae bacterium]|nr:hypothetical protein [Acidimicrobiaceae bacterium]
MMGSINWSMFPFFDDEKITGAMARPVRPQLNALWPIVGRTRELTALAEGIDDASCSGVVLIGPAGVGKTRLAREVRDLANERGLFTGLARATKSASGIPLGALVHLLTELEVPELTGRDLFNATVKAIDERRGTSRMVLVVDDANELDDASVALLDQLMDQGSVFVVLTVRTGEQTIGPVVDMWKDERVLRIDVAPLTSPDVQSLSEIAVGGLLDSGALQALQSASAGNVLYLRELIMGALESGVLARDVGIWRLTGPLANSPRLRDLIEQRLTGITEVERETLELVALGDPLELSLLTALVPPAAVERMARRGVLEAVPGDHDPEVHLAHPLYGEVVRAHLSPIRRTRLCRSLANLAEQKTGLKPADVLRVAVWRLDGGGGGRPETTVQAARLAFQNEDYRLSTRLARAAWDEWDLVEAAILLADSIDIIGRSEDIEDVLAPAADRASSDRERADVAVRRAAALFLSPGRSDEADGVLTAATAIVDDPLCQRDIASQRADHFLLSGDVTRAIELDEPLVATPGDSASAQAARDLGTALALAGRTKEAIRHTEDALATRLDLEDAGQVSSTAIFVVAHTLALVEAGRLAEAASTCMAAYEIAVERKNAGGQAWFASILAFVRLADGRLATAVRLFRESAGVFRELHHPGQRWGLGGIALAAGQLGDREASMSALAELDAVGPASMQLMDVHIWRGRAWGALAAGSPLRARAHLRHAVELGMDWGQLAAAAAALHDLVRIGDSASASQELMALADQVDGDLMTARAAYARAVASRNIEEASEATELFEASGAFLYAA